jgi:hypothetical protein
VNREEKPRHAPEEDFAMTARTTITPGDRVTVEIQYSDRPVLRPLIGKLHTVEITADRCAIIYEDDGRRYQFYGRTVPAVALVEASIFTDPATRAPTCCRRAGRPGRHRLDADLPLRPRLRLPAPRAADDQRRPPPGLAGPAAQRRGPHRTVVPTVVLPARRAIRPPGLLRDADDARPGRLGVPPGLRAPPPVPVARTRPTTRLVKPVRVRPGLVICVKPIRSAPGPRR